MAEAAALLDRLASGLDEFPRRSTVPSSSAKERTEPPDRTCCWSLSRGHGETGQGDIKKNVLCDLFFPEAYIIIYFSENKFEKIEKIIILPTMF